MGEARLTVEVAYALPERQYLLSLNVPAGTTAREAVTLSGIATLCPEIDISQCPLGVFGEIVDDGRELIHGDRVEIYRPLRNDPREKRRQLAAQGRVISDSD